MAAPSQRFNPNEERDSKSINKFSIVFGVIH